ncbi:MAG: response regulator [Deltaproteobacteria bacterium]|nr:response regulator [Deltaproteobacteria bacterium]
MSQVNIPNVKIAVIDDDLLARDFIVTVLMYCVNRDVLSFDSGLAAWQYIKDHGSLDIIISGIDVPGLSGFKLLSKFKKKYPEKKCIMTSLRLWKPLLCEVNEPVSKKFLHPFLIGVMTMLTRLFMASFEEMGCDSP